MSLGYSSWPIGRAEPIVAVLSMMLMSKERMP
jgi:hypothetical protein